MTDPAWPFDVPPDAAVVTTSYVTKRGLPILEVSHEWDDEEGVTWQFHCGNGDYDPAVIQLVRLDEILRVDPALMALASLPLGASARRNSSDGQWIIA
jgi:hypothetical protein